MANYIPQHSLFAEQRLTIFSQGLLSIVCLIFTLSFESEAYIIHLNMHVGYPENKFCLRILPLQRCSHNGAHACRVCFADIQTVFTHQAECL